MLAEDVMIIEYTLAILHMFILIITLGFLPCPVTFIAASCDRIVY